LPKLHPHKPCNECPWRRDVETGHFPPERFEALATTAYDRSMRLFQCHKTSDERPKVCAGFLLRGAMHNISARLALARHDIGSVEDGGYPLFDTYREMAVANGVDPNHEALDECRDD
jgi:hypothetical protein